jgi:hypothetical protein
MSMGPYYVGYTRSVYDLRDGNWQIFARNRVLVTARRGADTLSFPTKEAAEKFLREHGEPETDYAYA